MLITGQGQASSIRNHKQGEGTEAEKQTQAAAIRLETLASEPTRISPINPLIGSLAWIEVGGL